MELSHNVNFIHQNKMTMVSLFKTYILQTSLQMLKSLSGIGNTSANCLSWTLMCIGDIINHFSRRLHESWMTWISSLFFLRIQKYQYICRIENHIFASFWYTMQKGFHCYFLGYPRNACHFTVICSLRFALLLFFSFPQTSGGVWQTT